MNISWNCSLTTPVVSLATIFFIMFAGTVNATPIDSSRLYTLSPADESVSLWSIDPVTGTTIKVIDLTLPSSDTTHSLPFRTNTIAFSPDNRLYGWSVRDRQLYEIDYNAGLIKFIGSPGDPDTVPAGINGMSFTKSGKLYGLFAANVDDGLTPYRRGSLYSIDTTSSHVSLLGPSYVDILANGMGVNFETDELFAVTGQVNNKPDYLLKIDLNPVPTLNEIHNIDNTENYHLYTEGGAAGMGAGTYDQTSESITFDGTATICSSGVFWCYASSRAEREMDIPSAGYAKLNITLTGESAGQTRLAFHLKESDDTYYRFVVTDDTYGGSGWTQGIIKIVDGMVVNSKTGVGSIALGGNEKMNDHTTINENIIMEVWWEPTFMKIALSNADTGMVIYSEQMNTSDTTLIEPKGLELIFRRLDGEWKSIEIQPGVTQIVGELGHDFPGVATEFNGDTLYTLRNNNLLYSLDLNSGLATAVFVDGLGDIIPSENISSVNLASPWPSDIVIPDNDPPVAENDRSVTDEDVDVTIFLLDNDSDVDGNLDIESVSITRQPENGTVTVNTDGTVTYTPDTNYSNCADSLIYQVCDTELLCDTAMATIIVVPVNDVPVAVDDAYSTLIGVPLIVAAPGVLGNDSDVDDGDVLTVNVLTEPTKGSLTLNDDGSFIYTPETDCIADSYTYEACDLLGECDTARVTITVNPVINPPETINPPEVADPAEVAEPSETIDPPEAINPPEAVDPLEALDDTLQETVLPVDESNVAPDNTNNDVGGGGIIVINGDEVGELGDSVIEPPVDSGMVSTKQTLTKSEIIKIVEDSGSGSTGIAFLMLLALVLVRRRKLF